MTTLSFACLSLLLLADPGTAPQRRYHEISRDLSAALQRESIAKDLEERSAAVQQLVVLFQELERDPRTPTSEALQEYRSKARGRLVSVQAELRRQMARQHKAKQGTRRSPTSAEILEQQVLAEEQRTLAQQLTMQVTLAHYASGGPGQIFATAGVGNGGGLVQADNGEALLELIETTIAPQSWAAQGGPGSIVYYRPLMCLVVRATGDTHRGVGGLLNALRQAGP